MRTKRINLLLKTLAQEEKHLALSSAYDDLLNKPTNSTVQTSFQTRGQLWLVGDNSTKYLNSFFSRAIRDLKIGQKQSNNSEIATQAGLSSCSVNTAQPVLRYYYWTVTVQHITFPICGKPLPLALGQSSVSVMITSSNYHHHIDNSIDWDS